MSVLRIEANGPLDVRAAIATLVNHEIAGLTETRPDELSHRRIVELEDGPLEVIVRLDPAGVTVGSDLTVSGPEAVSGLVRGWFDLDSEITAIDRHLGAQPRFSAQVRDRPGIRITGHPGAFESSILIVLGQQISLAAARTFAARLVRAYGEKVGDLIRFPSPERLSMEPPDRLREEVGIPGARARTIGAVASLFAELVGAKEATEASELIGRLAAVPGVGPWTTAYVSLRGLGLPDEFPATDAVVRRALDGIASSEASAMAASWSPYRSYATVRLWAEYAGAAA